MLKLYVGSAYYDKGERARGWGEFFSRPRIQRQDKNWELSIALFGRVFWLGRNKQK